MLDETVLIVVQLLSVSPSSSSTWELVNTLRSTAKVQYVGYSSSDETLSGSFSTVRNYDWEAQQLSNYAWKMAVAGGSGLCIFDITVEVYLR